MALVFTLLKIPLLATGGAIIGGNSSTKCRLAQSAVLLALCLLTSLTVTWQRRKLKET
jgi:hypothetical protein